jgi:hypothetical protein
VAEHLVAAQLELRLAIVGEVFADRFEEADQIVERGVFADLDEVFDSSGHGWLLRREAIGI